MNRTLRGLGIALVCAKLVFVPIVFDYGADVPFVVPKALVSHALAYLLAAVLLALWAREGTSFFPRSPLHAPAIAFLVANCLATLFAADKVLALYGTHARMLGLGSVADWVLLYFGVVLLVRNRADVTAIVISLLGASAVVLGYELVQVTGRDPLNWALDPTVRPFSTLGQPTSLAQFLITLASGSFGFALLVVRSVRARLFLVAYGVLLLGGALATGTRSPLVGLALGGVVLGSAVLVQGRSGRARLLSLVGGAAGVGVLTLLVALSPLGARVSTTLERVVASNGDSDSLEQVDPSTATRVALYDIAIQMLRERPLLGYGPDSFVIGVPEFRPERAPAEIRTVAATSAHSWLASIAAGSGLLGVASFAALIFTALFVVVRHRSGGIAVVSGAMLASFIGTGLTTIDDLGANPLLWLSLGGVAASTIHEVSGTAVPRKSARAPTPAVWNIQRRRVIAIGLLAAALALSATTPSALTASRLHRSAQLLRLAGHTTESIEQAKLATATDPRRAEYWHGLGLAYVGAARFREAIAPFDVAVRLAPYEVRYLSDSATAQLAAFGLTDKQARMTALQLTDRAVAVDPNSPSAHLIRAQIRALTGDFSGALASVNRALYLDPQSTNDRLYVAAAQINIQLGRLAEAIAIAHEGLAILGLTPASVALRYELARALATSGQTAAALIELETSLSIQPNQPEAERLRTELRAGIQK